MMPPKNKFADGEKVLCYHGPLIYEAKCLKSAVSKEKQIKYYIHYAGWNKNWDEWVPENRVLKHNEANVQKQKELQKNHQQQQSQTKQKKIAASSKVATRKSEGGRDKSDKESDSRASTPISALEKPATRPRFSSATPTQDSEQPRKKRGRTDQSENDEFHTRVEVKISIPENLKLILVDESELILKQKKLCGLPARINVEKILTDYVDSKEEGIAKESALETTKGIREYFNVVLGLQLLYKYERPQYEDIMSEDSEAQPSQIYGAFHLLRLFVKFGNILSYTSLDERSIQLLVSHFQEFLVYLSNNSSTLFDLQQDYVVSTPDYQRKVMQL